MKIVLVISTLVQGGAERVMSELSNIWFEQGHDVHLVLFTNDKIFYYLEKKIKITRLNFTNNGRLSKVSNALRAMVKLRLLLKHSRPDFVLSFITQSNIATILSSLFLGVNVFVSDRSNPFKKQPTVLSILRRLSYRYSTGIIAQTSTAKMILEKSTGNKNIYVIPNPIREIKLNPKIKKEKIILNIGRFVPEKGTLYLLEAFARIEGDGWKLILLGDGPLRTNLENKVKELGLSNSVQMPGIVKNVDDWLSRASIFAFSSISEGFPNALAEAMAAGLPCISFDCNTGPRDIIRDTQNGFLVPVRDSIQFSARLNYLINDSITREKISRKAKETAVDLEKNKIADIYLKFMSK
jgi:glycosyltransferase involved in cell wall biosynthesis